jgi:signal transduction histidine kinase
MSGEGAHIVFSHLVDNAIQHKATVVSISATENGDAVRIVVSDNGEGISPANRDRLFDAFFTTRRDSGGTGMGLNVVQSMLRAHGGGIKILDSREGATFEVTLPKG